MYNSAKNLPSEEHEESFFVSMTDMMIGMLFIFIIMLMFFAMKFSDDSNTLTTQVDALAKQRDDVARQRDHLNSQLDLFQEVEQVRRNIVNEIYTALKQQGVNVIIDEANGILRLPESVLFAVNQAELLPAGREAVRKLARELAEVLPCYAIQPGVARPQTCPRAAFGLETMLIEGHADSTGNEDNNRCLSMRRALYTYQTLADERPALKDMRNRQSGEKSASYPLMAVAGYGDSRPVADNDTAGNRSRNRRIDIRFIMAPPSKQEIDAARQSIQ